MKLAALALGTFLGVVIALRLVYGKPAEWQPDPGYLAWLREDPERFREAGW